MKTVGMKNFNEFAVNVDVAAHIDPSARTDGPDRLGYALLNANDLAVSKDLFIRVVGVRISDWYEDDELIICSYDDLLHCVVPAPGRRMLLNHVAFEVDSSDEASSPGSMRNAPVGDREVMLLLSIFELFRQ